MPVCRIISIGDILILKEKMHFLSRPASFKVDISCATTLHTDRKQKLERRLAFALSDCGCILASLSMVLIFLFLFLIVGLPLTPFLPNSLFYLLSVFTGASIAKLTSLTLTYYWAHRMLDEILNAILNAGQPSNA